MGTCSRYHTTLLWVQLTGNKGGNWVAFIAVRSHSGRTRISTLLKSSNLGERSWLEKGIGSAILEYSVRWLVMRIILWSPKVRRGWKTLSRRTRLPEWLISFATGNKIRARRCLIQLVQQLKTIISTERVLGNWRRRRIDHEVQKETTSGIQ